MFETHDTVGTNAYKDSARINNRAGSNALSVDDIMGSQEASLPQQASMQESNIHNLVKNYKIDAEATRPDRKKASQGLKMYIGKNSTINMSRHK